jgi:hypothetical protein
MNRRDEMKLRIIVTGALLTGWASTVAAIEAPVPVTAEWAGASRLIDTSVHIQPIREIDWAAGHPRRGYEKPDPKPGDEWPEFRDIELPRGIELPAYLRRPSRDPEDDVVRCMAIGCEKG